MSRVNHITKQKWIYSWAGLEEYRDKIRAIAHEAVASDVEVRKLFPSSVATGYICEAIRDPSLARTPEVARAARAQQELGDLHASLVWDHNLEFDFVRLEWAPILDPSSEERELCERLAQPPKSRGKPQGKRH